MNAPFVPDNFICDSSKNGGIVEQTTSWLTINPVVGCSLSCAYCFREKWKAPSKPFLQYTVQDSISALEKHPLFIPNETPLSINISSTDALLPGVKKITFECLRYLNDRGYRNITGITSKLKLTVSDIMFLKKLKNLRLVFLVSYAEIPPHIEPVPIKPRINNLKILKENGIPNILYFRPIVNGWNNTSEKIETVLKIGEHYASAIAIGGLRISPEIILALTKAGVELPRFESDFHPKELSEDIVKKILAVYNRLQLTTPLFKHTSCAVSYLFDIPNYNALFVKPQSNCITTCPILQQKRCGISLNQQA